ncbi:MAG: DJ-1/PfpI family protein [Rhizomicrobium sp.]
MKIGILIFDDVEELDFVGPWEVFTVANQVAAHLGKPAPHDVFLVAEKDGPIRCAKGMRVLPDRTTAQCDALDVLLVPRRAGHAARGEQRRAAELDRQNREGCQMGDERPVPAFCCSRRLGREGANGSRRIGDSSRPCVRVAKQPKFFRTIAMSATAMW